MAGPRPPQDVGIQTALVHAGGAVEISATCSQFIFG
jgi:hypothetical protein